MWMQERFKRMKEAKLVRDSLLKDECCFGVHIYKGHRHVMVRWQVSKIIDEAKTLLEAS